MSFLLSLISLALLYTIWIQHKRGGPWEVLYPLALFAGPLDILLNYTVLAALFWDWPVKGEYTFSKRLPRLCKFSGWRGRLAKETKYWLNKVDPLHNHIKE